MKNKKVRKGKGKGKSKHGVPIASPRPNLPQGITPSVDRSSSPSSGSSTAQAQPTPWDDLGSPSTISPLPGHESSPRGRDDELKAHTTKTPPPRDEQAPTRPLYADIVRGRQRQEALQPPVQSEEILDNSSEDHDEDSPDNSSQDNDNSTDLDRYSEDHDDFIVGKLKTGMSISATMFNEHNAHPQDAAEKGKQPTQKQTLQPPTPMRPKQITPPPDPHPVRNYARALMADQRPLPPPDPRPAGNNAHALMADQRPLPPPASHRAANGASGTSGAHDLLVPQQTLDYSSKDHDDHFSLIKLLAFQKVRVGANFEKEEVPKIKEICEPHVGFLKSIHKFGRFVKKHPLMGRVKIFRGRMTVLLATTQGRLLAQAMVAVIWECHSQNRSWNGTFDIEHIRIIEPWNSKEFMIILKESVEFKGKALLQAKANDLDTAAAILKTLYMVGDDYAVYFDDFVQDLQQAIRLLAENERAFMEYLSHHPAIMPSTGRSTFVSRLSNIRKGPVMLSKSPAYPYDWTTIVESEINGKIKAQDINYDKNKKDTDNISVLYTVYNHTNNYDHTVSGLIRFMRNVLEHGKEHDDRVIHGYELELYLAKMFSGFLPITLQNMLMSGRMELYGEDWSTYERSKRNKWEPAWSELITTAEEFTWL